MNYLHLPWPDFVRALRTWEKIPLPARNLFLEQAQTAAKLADPALFGPHLPVLQEAGLVELSAVKQWVKTTRTGADLQLAIKGMMQTGVFQKKEPYVLNHYLSHHFRDPELEKLFRITDRWHRETAFQQAATRRWVEQFLATEDFRAWEGRHRNTAEQGPLIATSAVFAAMKELLRHLMASPGPVAVTALPAMGSGAYPEDAPAAALGALIESALIFIEVLMPELTPAVWIFPELAAHLQRKRPAAPPEPVASKNHFSLPFLVEDMTSILVACAGSPLRLRAQDGLIYERDAETLSEGLVALPPWVTNASGWHGEARITHAAYRLYDMDFVEMDHRSGKTKLMKMTQEGTDWLSLPPKGRVRAVLNRYRQQFLGDGVLRYVFDKPSPTDPFYPFFAGGVEQNREVLKAALLVLLSRDGVAADHPVKAFLDDEAFRANPLLSWNPFQGEALHVQPQSSGYYARILTENEREDLWLNLLLKWLFHSLLPLGAIGLGICTDRSGDICFRLTDLGSYLTGATKDFDYQTAEAENIVVQPNFEVVFLAPSPLLETEIHPFAERKGAKVGVLFRITKASIYKAAAEGWTGARVLEVLRRISTREIPANVEKEIEGWFGQCRRIATRPAVLITCPDAETALKVLAVARPDAERISDTVVALWNVKGTAAVLRKLSGQGVFLEKPVKTHPK